MCYSLHGWWAELRLFQNTSQGDESVHVKVVGLLAVRGLAVREDLPEENAEGPAGGHEISSEIVRKVSQSNHHTKLGLLACYNAIQLTTPPQTSHPIPTEY